MHPVGIPNRVRVDGGIVYSSLSEALHVNKLAAQSEGPRLRAMLRTYGWVRVPDGNGAIVVIELVVDRHSGWQPAAQRVFESWKERPAEIPLAVIKRRKNPLIM